MPSKKKKRGRRATTIQKVKGSDEAMQAKRNNCNKEDARTECLHVCRDNCTDDVWDAAQELLNVMHNEYGPIVENHGQSREILMEALFEFCGKNGTVFRNPMMKDAFLKTLIYKGSDVLLRLEINEDEELPIPFAYCIYACAYELIDKHDGVLNTKSWIDIGIFERDVMVCHRELARFYHKKNSCDCLKALYSRMKKTRDRKTNCFGCTSGSVKNCKEIKVCSGCKVAQYCSRECQLSHWAEHKIDCNNIRKFQAGGP